MAAVAALELTALRMSTPLQSGPIPGYIEGILRELEGRGDTVNPGDVFMVFVPCKDGISHNINESAEPNDLAAGCNVLLRAVLASAG